MASAFLVGCGVAGAAYALKGAIHVGQKLQQNPEAMKQAAAIGAGLKGVGSVFKVPSFLSWTKHAGGFDAAMNRREAALILNVRCGSTCLGSPLGSRPLMCAPPPPQGVGLQGRAEEGAPDDYAAQPPGSRCAGARDPDKPRNRLSLERSARAQVARPSSPQRSTRRTSACPARAAAPPLPSREPDLGT